MEIYVKRFNEYFVLTICEEIPRFIDKNNDTDIYNMLYRETTYLANCVLDLYGFKATNALIDLAKKYNGTILYHEWKAVVAFNTIEDANAMKDYIKARIVLNRLQGQVN